MDYLIIDWQYMHSTVSAATNEKDNILFLNE